MSGAGADAASDAELDACSASEDAAPAVTRWRPRFSTTTVRRTGGLSTTTLWINQYELMKPEILVSYTATS